MRTPALALIGFCYQVNASEQPLTEPPVSNISVSADNPEWCSREVIANHLQALFGDAPADQVEAAMQDCLKVYGLVESEEARLKVLKERIRPTRTPQVDVVALPVANDVDVVLLSTNDADFARNENLLLTGEPVPGFLSEPSGLKSLLSKARKIEDYGDEEAFKVLESADPVDWRRWYARHQALIKDQPTFWIDVGDRGDIVVDPARYAVKATVGDRASRSSFPREVTLVGTIDTAPNTVQIADRPTGRHGATADTVHTFGIQHRLKPAEEEAETPAMETAAESAENTPALADSLVTEDLKDTGVIDLDLGEEGSRRKKSRATVINTPFGTTTVYEPKHGRRHKTDIVINTPGVLPPVEDFLLVDWASPRTPLERSWAPLVAAPLEVLEIAPLSRIEPVEIVRPKKHLLPRHDKDIIDTVIDIQPNRQIVEPVVRFGDPRWGAPDYFLEPTRTDRFIISEPDHHHHHHQRPTVVYDAPNFVVSPAPIYGPMQSVVTPAREIIEPVRPVIREIIEPVREFIEPSRPTLKEIIKEPSRLFAPWETSLASPRTQPFASARLNVFPVEDRSVALPALTSPRETFVIAEPLKYVPTLKGVRLEDLQAENLNLDAPLAPPDPQSQFAGLFDVEGNFLENSKPFKLDRVPFVDFSQVAAPTAAPRVVAPVPITRAATPVIVFDPPVKQFAFGTETPVKAVVVERTEEEATGPTYEQLQQILREGPPVFTKATPMNRVNSRLVKSVQNSENSVETENSESAPVRWSQINPFGPPRSGLNTHFKAWQSEGRLQKQGQGLRNVYKPWTSSK